MPVIHLETLIRAPIELCFDSALNVDVHVASTSGLHGRAVAGITHGMMKLDDEVTWEAVHLGILQRLTSRITALERPRMFVDEMQRGAFKSWRHQHFFEAQAEGTLMTDHVTYASPLGLLGHLVDTLYLENYMKRFLVAHNKDFKKLLEAQSQTAF
jgi:ligand-binding SRPBCC domain-containing protein